MAKSPPPEMKPLLVAKPESVALAEALRGVRDAVNKATTALDFGKAVNIHGEEFFEPLFSVSTVSKTLSTAAADALEDAFEDLDLIEDFLTCALERLNEAPGGGGAPK